MHQSRLWKHSGFSLMELMVVVAILSILMSIAVPKYQTFQARARQKEGFNLLNSYYSAAVATRTEFGRFEGNFVLTGFQPTGEIGYRLRCDDNAAAPAIVNGKTMGVVLPGGIDDDICFRTQAVCDCGGGCTGFKTWVEKPAGGVGVIGIAGVVGGAACPGGDPVTTDTTFRAQVAGWISIYAAAKDKYQITETKTISMCGDGLK